MAKYRVDVCDSNEKFMNANGCLFEFPDWTQTSKFVEDMVVGHDKVVTISPEEE